MESYFRDSIDSCKCRLGVETPYEERKSPS